ncbi:MAG: ribonuclease BN, partial [Cutibacterium sp.]|nr:ribonuclease BN [Cutibacterium sp.]
MSVHQELPPCDDLNEEAPVKDTITGIMKRPSIAHLLRAHTRFNRRLGNHFAASITYFTVLAIIPVVAFAFAV